MTNWPEVHNINHHHTISTLSIQNFQLPDSHHLHLVWDSTPFWRRVKGNKSKDHESIITFKLQRNWNVSLKMAVCLFSVHTHTQPLLEGFHLLVFPWKPGLWSPLWLCHIWKWQNEMDYLTMLIGETNGPETAWTELPCKGKLEFFLYSIPARLDNCMARSFRPTVSPPHLGEKARHPVFIHMGAFFLSC